MPITIGSNIASLDAQRVLGQNSTTQADIFTRLSSGMRINKASDDAAGLAIASSLNADSRVYISAVRNLNDGISALNIIDGALSQGSNIITRLKELATQSANGVYSNTQRSAIDTEGQALRNEYNRVMATTSFNKQNLLDGSTSNITLQAGYGTTEQLTVPVGSYAPNISSTVTTTTGDGTFHTGVSYATSGASSHSVITADLNSDGNVDLISTYTYNGSGVTSVQLGNGDGTFKTAVTYATGADPRSVVAVDLNGDGKLDLVTANTSGNNLSVELGNGDGTFKAMVTYSTGVGPVSITAADLNGDGKVDLITADTTDNKVSVQLGNGDGTFKARVSYSTGAGNDSVIVADVNGDGKLDILDLGSTDNKVDVQLGNGDGTFQARVSYSTGANPVNVTAADLNGDGILDLVTSDHNDNKVSVQLGNGDGTFKARVSYSTGVGTYYVTAADLNGDGKVDLIDVDASDNKVSVQLGNGDGTFKARVSYSTSSNPNKVVAADLNNDGVLDLVSDDFSGHDLTVFLANATTTAIAGSYTYSLTTFSLLTQSAALSALDTFTTAQTNLETALGGIGSWESRIQTAVNNVSTTIVQDKAAESRITDTDVGSETAELTRLNILQQTGAAILAQANQLPALALTLLRG